MKKSFFKYLFIFLILCASPFFVYSQSPNPELPDEQSNAGDSLLPGKDEINPSAPSELDSVDFGTEPPAQKETFPTGSGYTENNGTATQPPTPPGSKNDSFPTGSGSTYGTGALLKVPTPPKQPTPTSVSIIDSLVSSKLFGDEPLDKLLNQLFYIGLIAAVILAIVMIIRGGLEYMTIDAITSKENGKNRVKAALGGLLLAFSAILILNTINPGLTKLNLAFPQLQEISQTVLEADITSAMSKYQGLSPEQLQELLASGKIPTNISPTAQKVLAEALNMIHFQTGTINGTESGRLACAAVVNMIFKKATGQEVGGSLSTAAMASSLEKDPRFIEVPGGYANALPGDIIISPTTSSGTGHVGIVASPGAASIISNSSSGGRDENGNKKGVPQVLQNHTPESWNSSYVSNGLKVLIYRPL